MEYWVFDNAVAVDRWAGEAVNKRIEGTPLELTCICQLCNKNLYSISSRSFCVP